ncbi:MAG: hypothetical protein SPJ54_00270 [Candidatus Onthomorpha sp.]|nr:hypothetical protein [Candidatus Onthomorpha sp.]
MSKTKSQCLLLVLAAVMLASSCGKKQEQNKKDSRLTTKQVQLNEDKPLYLPEGFSVSGLKVNDTVNNIKVDLLWPLSKDKNNKVSPKPIQAFSNVRFKAFVSEAKAAGKISGKFHTLKIRPVFANITHKMMSCLLEEKSSLAEGEQAKLNFGVTYRISDNKVLDFCEVFAFEDKDFATVRQAFGESAESFDREDFCKSSFAIGTDSVFVFIYQDRGRQTRLAAAVSLLETFMTNGTK